jgi:UDP-glucuronate 4-epimerase
MRKPLKILITGAAGFIGSALTQYLVNLSGCYHVTAIDNINFADTSAVAQLAKLRAKTFLAPSQGRLVYDTCDITIPEDVERVFSYSNFDVVVHLAAKAGIRESLTDPYAYATTNLVGFTNVIEAARKGKVRQFMYASSSSVYGANSTLPFSESEPANTPMSFYAATKRANEMMAYSYSSAHNLETIGLRFFTVYGRFSRLDMAPFKFTDAIINDRPIDVYNYGNNTRDFTHISEVVRFIESSFYNVPDPDTVPASIMNVGNGQPSSVLEFIGDLERAVGKKAITTLMPPQIGDMEHTSACLHGLNDTQRHVFISNRLSPEYYRKWRQEQIQQMVNWVKLYQSYNAPLTPAVNMLLQ